MISGRQIALLLLCLCLVPAFAAKSQPAGVFSDELDAAQYDCNLTLTPAATLAADSAVTVALEWGDGKSHIQVNITRQTLTVATMRYKKAKLLGQVASGVTPGAPYLLTILRREGWLGLMKDGKFLYRGEVPRAGGAQAGITAGAGWTVNASTIQRLEPVIFTDDFMRAADEQLGAWTVQRGHWALYSAWDDVPHGKLPRFSYTRYAQNPFAWVGRAEKEGDSALCTAGKAYWEDYQFSVSVRPGHEGATGVMFNMTDEKNGLLVRWSSLTDADGQRGNSLILYRVADGKLTELARDAGGYIPLQWYKLAVSSAIDGVRVFIDGHERLAVKDVSPWRGSIGLYSEGSTTGVVFDDVAVYGHSTNADLLLETRLNSVGQQFLTDPNGMKEWSINALDWNADPGNAAHHWYRWDVYGDHQWITLSAKPTAMPNGELWLGLNGDGQNPLTGYRAVVQVAGTPPKPTYTLYRDTTVLATKQGEAYAPDTDYTFRLWRIGARVFLKVDDKEVVAANEEHPLSGTRAYYRNTGCFTQEHDVLVLSHNMLDYVFTDAPTDWLNHGTWIETIRWSCSPNWSFLSGWSRGDAVLWHKYRVTGDQEFQAFMGPKMEYPREREYYELRYRDFGVAICSDGRDPRSGYAGLYGAPAEDGTLNQRTVLMRKGVVVAQAPVTVAGKGANHRNWFDLQLHKHGDVVEFWVEGQMLLSYKDPEPIKGGVPAIWTEDNGICVSRARLRFANAPELNTAPQVVLDTPWYPEWGNVGRPLTLEFPRTWSTTGKPISLAVAKKQAPDEKAPDTHIAEKTLTFTPKSSGYHWYQVTAGDGANSSEPFDLFFPVFNPALGRDDAHALVLYRFDEGKGKIIHDHSPVTPAADLSIMVAKDAKEGEFDDNWLPGQGLNLHDSTPIITSAAVGKLMAIAKNHAASLECWVATDTLYTTTGWSSCLASWVTADNTVTNFAFGHYFSGAPGNVIFLPQGAAFAATDPTIVTAPGFRTGLQHIMVTWDGTTTRMYINGKNVGEKAQSWNTDKWKADALLVLGNQGDFARGYRGTFYLLAIHDRCFTADEVLRHYNAGPSAR